MACSLDGEVTLGALPHLTLRSGRQVVRRGTGLRLQEARTEDSDGSEDEYDRDFSCSPTDAPRVTRRGVPTERHSSSIAGGPQRLLAVPPFPMKQKKKPRPAPVEPSTEQVVDVMDEFKPLPLMRSGLTDMLGDLGTGGPWAS